MTIIEKIEKKRPASQLSPAESVIPIAFNDIPLPPDQPITSNNTFSLHRSVQEIPLGASGLTNLGNTCFMNSALQCLSNTSSLTYYILSRQWENELNRDNPLGMQGQVASAYAHLITQLWAGQSKITPSNFKYIIGQFNSTFLGYSQQDSQELVNFLLDGLHEDLNRIKKKPYVEMPDMTDQPDEAIAKKAWEIYRLRNDSIIVDLFQGEYKSRVTCTHCGKWSVTFDPYMFLTVPIPDDRTLTLKLDYITSNKKPISVTITVPKNSTIHHLGVILSEKLHRDSKNLAFYEVFQSKIYKTIKDFYRITEIQPSDQIFVYNLDSQPIDLNISEDPFHSLPGAIPSLNSYFSSSNSSINVLLYFQYKSSDRVSHFAYPIFIKVPSYFSLEYYVEKDCTDPQPFIIKKIGHLLYRSIIQQLGPFFKKELNPEIIQYLFKLECFEKAVTNTSYGRGMGFNDSFSTNAMVLYDGSIIDSPVVGSDLELRTEPITFPADSLLVTSWDKEIADEYLDFSSVSDDKDSGSINTTETQPKNDNPITLYSCLNEFMKEETLGAEDTWYCPKCRTHRQIKKKIDIWTAAEVLVIQMKRFSNHGRFIRSTGDKIDSLVEFPILGFDMKPFINGPQKHSEDPDELIYDLHAISNHYGGLGGGHYTAYAKNPIDENWYHFDDSHVSRVSSGSIMTDSAYLLFYQRRKKQQYDISGVIEKFKSIPLKPYSTPISTPPQPAKPFSTSPYFPKPTAMNSYEQSNNYDRFSTSQMVEPKNDFSEFSTWRQTEVKSNDSNDTSLGDVVEAGTLGIANISENNREENDVQAVTWGQYDNSNFSEYTKPADDYDGGWENDLKRSDSNEAIFGGSNDDRYDEIRSQNSNEDDDPFMERKNQGSSNALEWVQNNQYNHKQ